MLASLNGQLVRERWDEGPGDNNDIAIGSLGCIDGGERRGCDQWCRAGANRGREHADGGWLILGRINRDRWRGGHAWGSESGWMKRSRHSDGRNWSGSERLVVHVVGEGGGTILLGNIGVELLHSGVAVVRSLEVSEFSRVSAIVGFGRDNRDVP